MPGAKSVAAMTLYPGVELSRYQIKIHLVKTTSILVCGESIIHKYFNSF